MLYILALRSGGQYIDAGSYDPNSRVGILLQRAELHKLAEQGYSQFAFVDDMFDLDEVLELLEYQLAGVPADVTT